MSCQSSSTALGTRTGYYESQLGEVQMKPPSHCNRNSATISTNHKTGLKKRIGVGSGDSFEKKITAMGSWFFFLSYFFKIFTCHFFWNCPIQQIPSIGSWSSQSSWSEKNNEIRSIKFLRAPILQVNNYEIIVKFFHIGHNLTWYSAIVHKFTRIYPVCSTTEVTKQFM